MHQYSQMLKTLADNLANLQRQLLTTNKASTTIPLSAVHHGSIITFWNFENTANSVKNV
jgi:hypothetical protein